MAMEDSSIGGRIGEILSHYGLKSGELAERIGVKAGTMSHFMSGRNKPSFDVLARLLESFPSLSPDWVIHGIGEIERSDGRMLLEGSNQMAGQNLAVQSQGVMQENPQGVHARNESPTKRRVTDTNTLGLASHQLNDSKVETVGVAEPVNPALFPPATQSHSRFTYVNNYIRKPTGGELGEAELGGESKPGEALDLFTSVNSIDSGFAAQPEAHVPPDCVADSKKPRPASAENLNAKATRQPAIGAGYHHYKGIRGEVSNVCSRAYAADESYEIPLGGAVLKPATKRRWHLRMDENENSLRGSDSGMECSVGQESCGTFEGMRSEQAAPLKPNRRSIDIFTDVNNRMSAFSDLAKRSDGYAKKLRTHNGRTINCIVHSHLSPDTNPMNKNGTTPRHKEQRDDTSIETKAQANVDHSVADCAEIILLLPEGQYLRFAPSNGTND